MGFIAARYVGTLTPRPGTEPAAPALEGEVSTSGAPGKVPLISVLLVYLCLTLLVSSLYPYLTFYFPFISYLTPLKMVKVGQAFSNLTAGSSTYPCYIYRGLIRESLRPFPQAARDPNHPSVALWICLIHHLTKNHQVQLSGNLNSSLSVSSRGSCTTAVRLGAPYTVGDPWGYPQVLEDSQWWNPVQAVLPRQLYPPPSGLPGPSLVRTHPGPTQPQLPLSRQEAHLAMHPRIQAWALIRVPRFASQGYETGSVCAGPPGHESPQVQSWGRPNPPP